MAEDKIATQNKLIVIGGSSGSLDALLLLLPALKRNFAFPVIIVMHRSAAGDNGLAEVLAARSSLQVKEADEKDVLKPGWIYLAPPDYHLLIEADGTLSLDVSEKVNYCRPSIDVSFMSAAAAYHQNLVAILFSGANADGAAGMVAVKQYGGLNIVQDPAEAAVSYMPDQAISKAPVDQILRVAQVAVFLNSL